MKSISAKNFNLHVFTHRRSRTVYCPRHQRCFLAMPELSDITVYVEALERRVLNRPLQSVRITTPFLLRTAVPPLDSYVVASIRANLNPAWTPSVPPRPLTTPQFTGGGTILSPWRRYCQIASICLRPLPSKISGSGLLPSSSKYTGILVAGSMARGLRTQRWK